MVLKQQLRGFMTVFPMVGVIASYEGRYCLWTLTRQIPILTVTLLSLMAVTRLVYPLAGIGWALAAGWVAFLVVLTFVTRRQWAEQALEEAAPGD